MGAMEMEATQTATTQTATTRTTTQTSTMTIPGDCPIHVSCGSAEDLEPNGNTFILLQNGTVLATGANQYGQLGIGNDNFTEYWMPVHISDVVQVYAGGMHTLFVHSDGTVSGAGANEYCELAMGNNEIDAYWVPVKIPGLENVRSVVAGPYYSSFFLLENGSVLAAGYNNYGQLGIGDISYNDDVCNATIVNLTETITAVRAGTSFGLFLTESGDVYGSGYNDDGELGLGLEAVDEEFLSPARARIGLKNGTGKVVSISAGYYASAMVTETGEVYTSGWGSEAYLGLNTSDDILEPTLVPELNGVKSVAGDGYCSSLVSLPNDRSDFVFVNGYNKYGELGINSTEQQETPIKLYLDNVEAVSTGSYHTAFLTKQGTVFVSGVGSAGEFGTGRKGGKGSPGSKVPTVAYESRVAAAGLDPCSKGLQDLTTV
eukprot:CAMPEP_0197627804 /NCGR_PEP_ID=MMETSP1338-20131121/6316_1 /TAXON_ID=43686 ORGANISM="Pelagodinium beii, Strain RCC1491" /NCGR_SAMPLE_ID=MMETSP1338 /ASSEMBLY_ACC=CAM_ASM_000754 /LENGTH=430 /DNA_ID=CAMNT_0043198627 /DNA_START=132 /DNA_END=1425 /DNA_ORIENTATION=+